MIIDILSDKIKKTKCPVCVGLDTSVDYLPENTRVNLNTLEDKAKAILDYNIGLIDSLSNIIPSVKVQVAYYEELGVAGLDAFSKTLAYARAKGLVVIADCKRNDIGSTAAAYSRAYLRSDAPFECDFLTVNGYLGEDGISPFIDDCKLYGKGIFVLAKTSNPGSGQLQDKILDGKDTLYHNMGKLIASWGGGVVGKCGYSSVGAVVGATHPSQAEELRKALPSTFFLVPGYGAQGGSSKDIRVCFDAKGGGAIVNNSRGILCAYNNPKYKGLTPDKAAYEAVIAMREDLSW